MTGLSSAVANVVRLVMWKTMEPPGARSPGPQETDPAATWHAPPAHRRGPTARPASVGSGSLTLTSRAIPVPLLWTVTVKPTAPPGATEAASAVFTIVTLAGWTVTVALAESSAEVCSLSATWPVTVSVSVEVTTALNEHV